MHQDGIDRPVDLQVYMPLNQEAIIGYYRLIARTAGDPMRLERAFATCLRWWTLVRRCTT